MATNAAQKNQQPVWHKNEAANTPETMMGAKIAWRQISEEKGRGVFALVNIKKGDIIETAPVVPVSKANVVESGEAPDGYLLEWDGNYEDEEYCMPLGYIMMYNHAAEPNIWLDQDYEAYTMKAIALRDIKAGEELCWDYACEPWWEDEESESA
jgi:hypothetical protein